MPGKTFRKVVLQLHLWIGIAAAVFLFLAGGSGALLVFEDQIDRALNPQLAHVSRTPTTLSLTQMKSSLERQYPDYRVLGFGISDSPDLSYVAYLQPSSRDGINVAVDPHSGKALGVWNNNRFTRKLHGFHTHLLAGEVGSAIVGWSSVVLLFLSVTGLILWWRAKVFSVNFQTSGPKFQYDLHSAVGVASSAVLLAFALTGIVVHWGDTAGKWADRISHVQPGVTRLTCDPHAPGARPLESAQLLSLAQLAVPGARITVLELPDRHDRPAMAIMKFPEDHTPAGRTRVLLDAYSGKVLDLTSSRAAPLAMAYVTRINREIHTGDIGGWPSRIIAAIFSLALPLLAVTGPLLWWQRRHRR